MEILKERPPFVTFETRAEEDREASIAAGHYVAKDVIYALITPVGSKDRIERIASEWLAQVRDAVLAERMDPAWEQRFKSLFSAWKESQEIPENGQAIKNWPVASPAQVKSLLNINIRTVEDLAAANEEAIGRLGMGGRALKAKAVEWLQSAQSTGKVTEGMVALKAENENLKMRNDALQGQVTELLQRVTALEGKPAVPASASKKL